MAAAAPYLILWTIVVLALGLQLLSGDLTSSRPEQFSALAHATAVFLNSNFAAALVGAATGGGISLLLARSASKETLRRDRELRREKEIADARHTMLKVKAAVEAVFNVYLHFEDRLEIANQNRLLMQPMWSRVPAVTKSGRVILQLELDELAVLSAAKRDDLANDAMLLIDRARSLIIAFERYCDDKLKMDEKLMPFLSEFEGTMVTTLINREKDPAVLLQLNSLEQNIHDLWRSVQTDLTAGNKMLAQIGPAFKAYFKVKSFMRLELVESDEHANRRPPYVAASRYSAATLHLRRHLKEVRDRKLFG